MSDDACHDSFCPDFTPAPAAALHHWTVAKQRCFIETLADTASVSHAARAAGMSRESAYRLRRREDAADFARAWEDALLVATQRLTDIAFERASVGELMETVKDGEVVSARRRTSDQLLMFLLRNHDAVRYGWLARPLPFDASLVDARAPAIEGFTATLSRLITNIRLRLADPLNTGACEDDKATKTDRATHADRV